MSLFELDISGYFINGSSVEESDFVPQCLKYLKQLVATKDVVDINLDSEPSIKLTKSSGFREYRKIESILNSAIEKTYPEYNIESNNDTLNVSALDFDDNVISILDAVGSMVDLQTSSDTTIDDVADVQAFIPTLTNKAYISFINLCNETRHFLENYGDIGQKRKWMLSKSDINAVAKAVFAPIKAWDAVGAECKMKKEEFDLLKSNLVQFSEDNACADLGEYKWNAVFEWMRERKTKVVKFTGTSDSFVAKIRTTVIDSKTKQRIGVIIATLSIVVNDSSTVEDLTKGTLPVFASNISFNIIAR